MPLEIDKVENTRLHSNKHFKKLNRDFGTFDEMKDLYPDNETILKKIFETRYRKTVGGCPKCGKHFATFKKIPNKLAYRCKCNKFKIFPLKGTHLEQCRVPLTRVVENIYEMFNSKHGVTATEQQRQYGGNYNTSLYNLHRISDWMGWCIERLSFTPGSIVEIDEVYPKVETGLGPNFKFKRGLGSERAHGVLVFSEREGITKAFEYDKTNTGAVRKLIEKYIDKSHRIHTDESTNYNFLSYNGYQHSKCLHKKKEYSVDGCHVNTVEGFNSYLKTNIHRIHKGVHPEFLQFYVDRLAFNHTMRSKSIFEVLDILFDSIPDLNESVIMRLKYKKKINNKVIHSRKAA